MNKVTRTVLAAVALSAGVAYAQAIAFITDLRGEVAVDGSSRPLVLSALAKGQKLTLGPDAAASIMYTATGREYALKGPGQFEVREAEVAGVSGAAPAARATEWRASNKVLTQVAQTAGASVRMRSVAPARTESAPKLVYPTDGGVGTLQPVFRWNTDAKAQGELTLFAAGQEKPVHRAKVTGASYRIPAKLKPDTEYTWLVAVGGEEFGTGRFRTLPAEAIQLLDKRRPGDKAEFSDRMLFALMLQDMGAVQEAKDAWAKLSQERDDLPELSALAK